VDTVCDLVAVAYLVGTAASLVWWLRLMLTDPTYVSNAHHRHRQFRRDFRSAPRWSGPVLYCGLLFVVFGAWALAWPWTWPRDWRAERRRREMQAPTRG
jgi:hypothetical protein